MAIVKANFTRNRQIARASIRYITHRPGKEEGRVTREIFGFDGPMNKQQAYRMIETARRGTNFFRLVISPDPKREDPEEAIDLQGLTARTMLHLEERLKKHVRFLAVIHADHSANRHIHAILLLEGRLSPADFRSLREAATADALSQRRLLGLALESGREQQQERPLRYSASRTEDTPRPTPRAKPAYRPRTCPRCGEGYVLKRRGGAYRCFSCGLALSLGQGIGGQIEEAGWEL